MLMLAGVGCQAPVEPEGPTVTRVTLLSAQERQDFLEHIEQTLVDWDYRLDRRDYQQGIITTHPETSAAFFEFWRPQPKPAYYWWESNLGTIQRQVAVELKPAAAPDEYDLNVQVDRRRFSLEERQVDNPAAAMRLYSSAAPVYGRGSSKLNESSHWIPLGRDGGMEQRLLADFIRNNGLLNR